MAYENLCMYCFEDMQGQTTCPHCGRDSRAAVPQVQMLPGSLVYHSRFLIGRALGQDATGIVYAAFDTKKENKLRIREYLPRDCAERLNDGAVVPMAGKEDEFENGIKRLRASVESVDDPRKRHFFFEENGTAYIAQRKSAAAAASASEADEEADEEAAEIPVQREQQGHQQAEDQEHAQGNQDHRQLSEEHSFSSSFTIFRSSGERSALSSRSGRKRSVARRLSRRRQARIFA